VRNDLHALEEGGFLHQPHTSAGRIPTDKGYRFYVDDLEPGSLEAPSRQQIRSFFDKAHGELEQMLADTSQLLSQLTRYAAVIVDDAGETATVRSIQLVSLSSRVVMLVVVLSNGLVAKHTFELDGEVDDARVGAATVHLAAHLTGATAGSSAPLPPSGDGEVDALVARATDALGTEVEPERVYVGGTSHMAEAFDAVETVRQVLTTLEQQFVVVTLVRDVLDRGDSVAIGTEHGVEPLAQCSVIVAPYKIDGEAVGSIGVLGPTRMHYPEALAAVAMVSQRLGKRLSDG
jgi:heat-inducible transcriptional repressor